MCSCFVCSNACSNSFPAKIEHDLHRAIISLSLRFPDKNASNLLKNLLGFFEPSKEGISPRRRLCCLRQSEIYECIYMANLIDRALPPN